MSRGSGAVDPVDPVDAVVVGGGIGGLSCALALARAGRRVRVLEQQAEFGEVGAGLQLAPNATRILREWGLLDAVVAGGVRPRRLVLRDALDGAELTHLDGADLERRYGAPYVVTHRTDLHAALLDGCRAAGVDLVTGVAVATVENVPGGAAAVSAGRSDAAAVVLGADGLGSRLRALLSADEPVSSAYVAYRGIRPTADLPAGTAPEDMVVHIGPGCHFVQYVLRGGAELNQVAVFRSPKALAGEAEWGTVDELDGAFTGTCGTVRSALAYLWRDRCWRMYDREPIEEWMRGRFALVGDAAHPMLQYLAQGACQAVEDAACLSACAAAADWDGALAAYQAERTARTARVQRTAREWGDLWHAGDEVGGLFRRVRNALLRDRDPADYRQVDWLYGEPAAPSPPPPRAHDPSPTAVPGPGNCG